MNAFVDTLLRRRWRRRQWQGGVALKLTDTDALNRDKMCIGDNGNTVESRSVNSETKNSDKNFNNRNSFNENFQDDTWEFVSGSNVKWLEKGIFVLLGV